MRDVQLCLELFVLSVHSECRGTNQPVPVTSRLTGEVRDRRRLRGGNFTPGQDERL